ncbi:MAG: MoaD/ThiS family protein [Planctomycetaceae bacterium]|nr:MoaD/ThiS family protein [Planctomycetaceae bacterium]
MTVTSTPQISVSVRLFAAARERAGAEVVTVQVPVNSRIADLRIVIGETVPSLKPLAAHLLFAIGTEYATDDAPLPASGEVVAFPPVSGG